MEEGKKTSKIWLGGAGCSTSGECVVVVGDSLIQAGDGIRGVSKNCPPGQTSLAYGLDKAL